MCFIWYIFLIFYSHLWIKTFPYVLNISKWKFGNMSSYICLKNKHKQIHTHMILHKASIGAHSRILFSVLSCWVRDSSLCIYINYTYIIIISIQLCYFKAKYWGPLPYLAFGAFALISWFFALFINQIYIYNYNKYTIMLILRPSIGVHSHIWCSVLSRWVRDASLCFYRKH